MVMGIKKNISQGNIEAHWGVFEQHCRSWHRGRRYLIHSEFNFWLFMRFFGNKKKRISPDLNFKVHRNVNISTAKQKIFHIFPLRCPLGDVILVLNLECRASHKLDAVVVTLQSWPSVWSDARVFTLYCEWGHMPAWPPHNVARVIRY